MTDGLAVATLGRREQVGALVRTAGDEGMDRLTALRRRDRRGILHRTSVDGTREDVDVAAEGLTFAISRVGGTDARCRRNEAAKPERLRWAMPSLWWLACIRRRRRRVAWRRKWLAPWRRVVQSCLPFVLVTTVAGLGIFTAMETYKPWPLSVIVRHLAAAPNCAAARSMGLVPARRGEPGYYSHHDANHDGIACEPTVMINGRSTAEACDVLPSSGAEQRGRHVPQLVRQTAELACLEPPELTGAVPLGPYPPDRRDDRGLIVAATDP